ncbi:MAG: DUF748 domain-containing protein [Candidatus Omnitrophica bacterium]|nr:DUF748 domain-containing protein [Candidatus Omnitrophota bacterium]
MNLLKKILSITLAAAFVVFAIIYVFLAFKGKAVIVSELEKLTKKKVTVGYFGIAFPLNLEIKNLNIEGLANVGTINISPSLVYLLAGKIALNKVLIEDPDFSFEGKVPGAADIIAAPLADVKKEEEDVEKTVPLRLIIKKLIIKDGRIQFTDHGVSKEGLKFTVKDINLNLSNLYMYPVSVITNFELSGRIPWRKGEEEGKIEASGWINLYKKDIQVALSIRDIDGIYFYPYYSNWVDLEGARIEKAKLYFLSNVQGLNNNVTVDCHLELADIVRKPHEGSESKEKAERITDAVLGYFKALDQGKITLDFTFKTKMDRPEFSFSNIKMAFEDKLAVARGKGFKPQDVLMLPTKLIEGSVKGATELSKAVIDGTFAVGNELKKAVEEVFKK